MMLDLVEFGFLVAWAAFATGILVGYVLFKEWN